MWGRLTNEKRRELARDGKFYTNKGTRYSRQYSEKLKMRGQYIDANGYKRYLDSDRLVHRSVIEKQLGRKLTADEEIHHRNRNKLDNRPKNLEVLTHKKHRRKHLLSLILTGRK